MIKISLNGAWKGRCILSESSCFDFEGSVPGCAINDLIKAGKLPEDIFWRDNAKSVCEYEKYDYVYKKKFDFSGETEGAVLRFERLDTYADVFVNGKKVYHGENGNHRHDVDVSEAIKQGENEISVHFFSPVEWVKDRPKRNGAFTTERLYTRRMQCTYGWDWVSRFLTCGLGDVTILVPENDEVITENVYIVTLDTDSESATVRVDVGFERQYSGRVLEYVILGPDGDIVCDKKKYCKEAFVRIDFDVPSPRLWYPLGYGKQPLYTFLLKDGEKTVYSESFGIRTVKIMKLPDAPGSENYQLCLSIKNKDYDFNESFSGFVLKINGEKIFCRGANWVPCQPYSTGDISERQTEILELCSEAGVNMLRIWGGGAFETPHFYSECSRLGITVTQDFLMACGQYPEEEDWFIEELKKEALYAVRLCRNQPCLVWWSGDNENAVWGSDTDENYSGRRAAYEGLAPVLYKEDPYRRFLPSSPFGGNKYASNTVGTTHNTQYLGSMLFPYLEKEELSDYKEEFKKFRARFIAEEPQLGAISLTSLRRFMDETDIFEGDGMWLYHTQTNPALKREIFEYLKMMTEKILGKFTDGHDRLFKLRYMQYEWIRVVMEQARREKGLCSGIIFWMMNECWPAASGWSLIDFYNLPKDGFYSFKRCAKPVLASIDYDGRFYNALIVNDGKEREIKGRLSLISADGKTVTPGSEFSNVFAKDTAETLIVTGVQLEKGEMLVFDIESDFGKDRAFYHPGALNIHKTEVSSDINEKAGTVTLSAESYVHAVTFSGNAIFEDNCFSLLPGETRTVSYRPLKDGLDTDISVEAYTV